MVVNKGAMVFHMLRAHARRCKLHRAAEGFLFPLRRQDGTHPRISSNWRKRTRRRQPSAETKAIGNAPTAAAENTQLAAVFHTMAAFHGRPGILPGIRGLPHQKGISDRRQGQSRDLDFFRMDVEMEVQTEGNPEYKIDQRRRNRILVHGGDVRAAETERHHHRPAQLHPEIEPAAACAWDHRAWRNRSPSWAATTMPCSNISARSNWTGPMPWRTSAWVRRSSTKGITPRRRNPSVTRSMARPISSAQVDRSVVAHLSGKNL